VVSPWRRRERELRRLGVDVTLVSPTAWNEGGNDVQLDRDGDDFVVEARTIGHHPYGFVYDPRPIWRALRSGGFDVIDIHEEPASLASAEVYLLTKLSRSRALVCLYCAQNIPKRYPPPFRWIERGLLRRVAGVHTCNEEAGRILRGKGFSGLVRDLGLGVDVERFQPAAAPDHGGPLRVGYVGRLEAHKGVEVLVRAIALTEGATLEVVGDGPARASVERAVREADRDGRVSLIGFRPQESLASVYPSFDVVAVPSLDTPSWIEQFGRVAVEAMASGAVVVASSSGALPEVVGDAGILVPPGDAPALAAALSRLRDEPELRRKLREAGLERARRFGWSEIAFRQREFYDELAGYAP
jgi:glycosyltransferase involved in cell wall biosynthesis